MNTKKEASSSASMPGGRVARPATSGTGATTRRAFLARSAALGAAGAFGGLAAPRTLRAAAPKRGGRLRMGISGSSTSDSLDPALPFSAMAAVIAIGQCRNGLIEVDAGGNLVPELCEEWESTTNDATGWRFRIRSGVEFHDGKSLEVEDVIFSINQHRASDKSALRALLSSIVEIEDDGARGLLIRLESGNADFPFLLSDPRLQIYPSGTSDFNSGIGTGGYILEVWDPGLRAFSRRNPNYWKEGHANFDEVETIAIEDVNTRTSALRSGDVDVINRVERATAKRLDAVEGVNVVVQNGYKHYTLPMRADTPPFDDNDVRLAIKHACKRQQLLDQILFGYGKLGNDHPIGDFNRYIATEEELPPPRDVRRDAAHGEQRRRSGGSGLRRGPARRERRADPRRRGGELGRGRLPARGPLVVRLRVAFRGAGGGCRRASCGRTPGGPTRRRRRMT